VTDLEEVTRTLDELFAPWAERQEEYAWGALAAQDAHDQQVTRLTERDCCLLLLWEARQQAELDNEIAHDLALREG
jgi:hypothetical protein